MGGTWVTPAKTSVACSKSAAYSSSAATAMVVTPRLPASSLIQLMAPVRTTDGDTAVLKVALPEASFRLRRPGQLWLRDARGRGKAIVFPRPQARLVPRLTARRSSTAALPAGTAIAHSGAANVIDIVDLPQGSPWWRQAPPVLQELRTELSEGQLEEVLTEGMPQGLRFVAAFEGDRCPGVARWRILATTHCRRKLYVDDPVTTATERSRGIGAGADERVVSSPHPA